MLLVINTGEKGGAGKSVVAGTLASYFEARKWSWKGIDLDNSNKQFATLGEERVKGFTLQERGELIAPEVTRFGDYIGGLMEAKSVDALILDLGGGQLDLVLGALEDTGLQDQIGGGITLVLAYTIVASVQSLSTLANNLTILDSIAGAHWLIVRNAWKGPLDVYDGSTKVRPHLRGIGAYEIDIERIRDEAILNEWTRSGQLLGDFLTLDRGFTLRAKLTSWASRIYEQLDRYEVLAGAKA
jgi:hypothetical protein